MKEKRFSEYQMVDVGEKIPTRRVCRAQGYLKASKNTLHQIQKGTLPKGNPLPLAEAAAFAAVKRTGEILPLCHPLMIDFVRVQFYFEDERLRVECEVSAHAKTGVEMEALSGVSAALLCIYDLAKGVDPVLSLETIRLNEKTGGKSGHWTHPDAESPAPKAPPLKGVSFAVFTLSDSISKGLGEDRSGPALRSALETRGALCLKTEVLPDDAKLLERHLISTIEKKDCTLIVTTGGTGLGPRDITPETLSAVSDRLGGRRIPGLGEKMRSEGARITPTAVLSRCEGYLIQDLLVVCLPGSLKGAVESLSFIEALIPHLLNVSRGAHHG